MKAAKVAIILVALAATSMSAASLSPDDFTQGHPANACSFPNHVSGAGWDVCWQQDDVRGQGIELNRVYFNNSPVIWKIGFPLSITQYEGNAFGPFKDTLGVSFGGQNPGWGLGSMPIHPQDCPRFFGVGTLHRDQHICVERRDGPEPAIAIWGRYNIFNYRFLQGYILDSRGTIEPFARLGGTLIDGPVGANGTNHFHHLYWRVDFDVGAAGNDSTQVFLRPDEDWKPYGKAPDLPAHCRQQIRDAITGWCTISNETALLEHAPLFTKWRVADAVDTNPSGHARSFEAQFKGGVPPDGNFTSFDVLALQHKGDTNEIGFEMPAVPLLGDAYLRAYDSTKEAIAHPVLWFALHAYHDPRDEEKPTMSYHHLSFTISPRDFLGQNPGEDSFAPRSAPIPSSPPQLPIRP